MILVAVPASATEFQDGYGAHVSGISPDAGPLRDETAFEIGLPGSVAPGSAPIIRNGKIYVLTASKLAGDRGEFGFEGKTEKAIFEVDLATAKFRSVVSLDVDGFSMSADDQHFYVVTRNGLQAFDIEDGSRSWQRPWVPASNVRANFSTCSSPALRGDWIYLTCIGFVGKVAENCPSIFASKVHRADGAGRWTWWNLSFDSFGLPTTTENCAVGHHRISVIGEHVYVAAPAWSVRDDGGIAAYPNAVFQLRETDGIMVRVYNSTSAHRHGGFAGEAGEQDPDSAEHAERWEYPPPTGTADLIFMRMGELRWVNPRTGEEVFNKNYETGNWGREEGAGMAFDGQRLFFTSGQKVLALDVERHKEIWPARAPVLDAHEYWEQDHLTVSKGLLYAHSNLHLHDLTQNVTLAGTDAHNTHTFWAFDADTGQERWRHTLPPSSLPDTNPTIQGVSAAGQGTRGKTWTPEHRFSVGEGVFVAASIVGNVLVIGRTAASIQPILNPINQYLGPGETINVDLGGTKPGAFGAPTEFLAKWDDGTVTEWQTSPRFNHTYEDPGAYEATFEVRNAANQSSTEAVRFWVGFQDPLLVQRELDRLRDGSSAPAMEAPTPSAGKPLMTWPFSILGVALLVLAAAIVPARLSKRRGALLAPRFRIESELGYGATSKVLLAHDTVLDRKVVLKQPLSPWLLEKKGRDQFLREAQILAKLNHPNVVAIHEVLPHEEPPMLVLEYVQQGSLKDRLKDQGKLAPGEAVRIGVDILGGLAHVHDHRIIHRDIKPGNILLADDGAAKLTDFNIAQPPADAAHTVSVVGSSGQAGSPSYMSPEQTREGALDVRSDLYAVGAVIYEMFTGTHYLGPNRESDRSLAERIQQQGPALPHPDVPIRMAMFLRKALAKKPAHRFANAEAMRQALIEVVRKTKAPLGLR